MTHELATEVPAPEAARSSAWGSALRRHRTFLVLIAGYVAAGYAAQELAAVEGMMRPLWRAETFLLFYGVAAYSAVVMVLLLRWKARDAMGGRLQGREAWRAGLRSFRELMGSPDGVGVILVVGLLPLFMNAFGSWKAAIPQLNAFSWDLPLMRLDRALHGGTDPWRLLDPLLRAPLVVRFWDYGYTLFIPAQTAVVLWQVWSRDRLLRHRFLLSYVLTWILLGTVAAIAMSSAGPCFYEAVVAAPDPFVPLFERLRAVHATYKVGALEAQQVLWASHVRGLDIPFAGISAMPSMHIALPTLFVLVGWRQRLSLRLIFLAYLGFNLIGSVLLGWHYAVDGYAAILGVLVIWAGVCFFTGRPYPAAPGETREERVA